MGLGLRRRCSLLLDRMRGGALVLMYHRVGDPADDPFGLCVRPDRFRAQLDVLRSRRVLPLDELVAAASRGDAADGIAITFDDGYADNLHRAVPLLRAAGMPATIFVSTGAIGSASFWWDRLAAITRHGGHGHPDGRRPLHDIAGRLRRMAPAEREAEIAGLAGSAPTAVPTLRPLDRDELRELARTPGIALGAHAVSHRLLVDLPTETLADEIAGSAAALSALTGVRPSAFAYPFGGLGEFDASAVAAVRAAGFAIACTTVPGRLRPGHDPLRLPRVAVRDLDAASFARLLDAGHLP